MKGLLEILKKSCRTVNLINFPGSIFETEKQEGMPPTIIPNIRTAGGGQHENEPGGTSSRLISSARNAVVRKTEMNLTLEMMKRNSREGFSNTCPSVKSTH